MLLIVIIAFWGTFVIVPAGHPGVCLWWGSVEKRIMGEGLNFKVPVAERVIKVDGGSPPSLIRTLESGEKTAEG